METKLDKQQLYDRYHDLWNQRLSHMNDEFDKDKLEFVHDVNIGFKWTHLLDQEIWMWIDLCCGEIVEYTQVPLDDFQFVVKRRGFTPRIVDVLRTMLVDLGIGEKLNEGK